MISLGQKKGQVTLFIIVGILIVSAILIFFLWFKPNYIVDQSSGLGLDRCINDATKRAIISLSPSAGFISPEFTYSFQGQEIPYLCYTDRYYETCVVQKPFLKQHFETQAEKLLKEDIETCYTNSINQLKNEGYDVTSGKVEYKIYAEPGVVRVELNSPTSISTQSFKKFNINVNSPIYEMLMISTSILQSEAGYGDSDTTTLMIYYPDYIIDKLKQSDGTTIYIMEHKETKLKFQFASRSLAWPPGYA